MPGFAGFMRTKVPDSKLASTLRSLLGNLTGGSSRGTTQKSAGFDPNQPRSGQGFRKNEQKEGYCELNETWLMESRVRVDMEHQAEPLQPVYNWTGVRVENFIGGEQSPQVYFQGSQRGLIPR
jgi:hypothetical protein